MVRHVAVHAWPQDARHVLNDLRSPQACAVICIDTPHTSIRHVARQLIRNVVCEALGGLWSQAPQGLTLSGQPGSAITVQGAPMPVALSLSHAPGLSVAAIRLRGRVGVDIMPLDAGPDGMPDWACVSQSYLGPHAYRQLAKLAPDQRAAAFAQRWADWEAGLKCLGLALTEWTPALQSRLNLCRVTSLVLPQGYCGSLAHQ